MKFNFNKPKNTVANYEGAQAWKMSPEMELYTAVVTSSLQPMTYEGADERAERITSLVAKCDDTFVAKLAVYARTVMNLRSVPLLLVVELARKHNGDDLVARTVERVVCRADEITELLACYQWRNPVAGAKKLGRLSSQIRKGLQRAFNKFDEYQLAKYNRSGRAVTLRDALFLTHPKAKDQAQQEIFDRIVSATLRVPYTWETELSALGQKNFSSPDARETAFTEKWAELVCSGAMGYMALMRNLRNILGYAEMPKKVVKTVTKRLSDRKAVLASKQLPFRFLAAYREVQNVDSAWTPAILDALEEAVQHSADNIAGFGPDTSVVIASDVSGSMYTPVSPRSTVRNYDIGLMLSMMLKSRCKRSITGIFGNTWRVLNLPTKGILEAVRKADSLEGEVGYSTNGHKVIEYLIENRTVVDKVMMFTDLQMWSSPGVGAPLKTVWKEYKKMAPGARLYLFDLNGYGTTPISLERDDVTLIAGWSDKVFDILEAVDRGATALDAIRQIEI